MPKVVNNADTITRSFELPKSVEDTGTALFRKVFILSFDKVSVGGRGLLLLILNGAEYKRYH